ncbi:MAG: hypothetical protein JNM99_23580 [Verrucomicrobiaceae bacterium]|nr:hypothetical protein [Verrucomicrobiaceae bacterium]
MNKAPPGKSAISTKRQFGGRNTSGGVGYEVDVACWLASRMLIGGSVEILDGVSACEISSLALQTDDVVDDAVLDLRDASGGKVFFSAKRRTGSVSLGSGKGTFSEVIESLVEQYFALPEPHRFQSRFVWALPSTAGLPVTFHLREALKAYRAEMPVDDHADFLRRRTSKERDALGALIKIVSARWRRLTGASVSSETVQALVSRIHVEVFDFGGGSYHDRLAQSELATHVLTKTPDTPLAWSVLREALSDANRRGLKLRPQQLRSFLTSNGIRLKSELDYSDDVALLTKMTKSNLARLREHRYLRFGSTTEEEVHLPREAEMAAFWTSLKKGHRLLTGEPGCGKSGLIHRLVEELHLKGLPVVLMLAEEMEDSQWTSCGALTRLQHELDDVLAHWPDGVPGYLITDALDAVRDPDLQAKLRRLLERILRGESQWTVIASVREFDLKHSQQLRELFPGDGVTDHSSEDFAGVSHFHLGRLREQELDCLVQTRMEIEPFVASARRSNRSEELHRSPFFLRLASDLLRAGVSPSQLADWSSPTLLLRRFWDIRIGEGAGSGDREAALHAICRQMLTRRSMSLSIKELAFNSAQRDAVNDLRSRGILQGPAIKHGARVGDEAIRFSHHLLHDYVIAKALIPLVAEPFVAFAEREPLAPILYLSSFRMALHEMWDAGPNALDFWNACIRMQESPQLRSITRIQGPLVAAHRVTAQTDVAPLLSAMSQSRPDIRSVIKTALHLSTGLADVSSESIRNASPVWCNYARKLGAMLSEHPSLESPILFLLVRLLDVEAAQQEPDRQNLNEAGRHLLSHHLTKPVNRGWRYVAATATRAICRTFDCQRVESERMLLAIMATERVALFPHEDLFDLAHEIKHLGPHGDAVVKRLFDVSFSTAPNSGEHRTSGSLILPFRTETRQDWELNRYSLAEYYQGADKMDPGLAATLVCIAWNAVEERQGRRWSRPSKCFQATFTIRGTECELKSDGSSNLGRQFEHEENTILNSFEQRLHHWCDDADRPALEAVVDTLARENRSAVVWQTVLEIASQHVAELGELLEEAVHEPLMLTMPDYRYGAVALFAALHRAGDKKRRIRLERTLLGLPRTTPLRCEDQREPTPEWIIYVQDIILGELDGTNIALAETLTLWRTRQAAGELRRNRQPSSLTQFLPSLGGAPIPDQPEGADPTADSIVTMSQSLDAIRQRDNATKVSAKTASDDLALLRRADRLIRKCRATHPEQTIDLWGRLTQTCSRLAGRRPPPRAQGLFAFAQRILLRAVSDPLPVVAPEDLRGEERLEAWAWPSPRSDAAEGLPFLVCRLRDIDAATAKALRRLATDGSRIVRQHLSSSLFAIRGAAPQLMWELIDTLIESEPTFRVLSGLLDSLRELLSQDPDKALLRMRRIAERAGTTAPDEHDIHEELMSAFLFRYLRCGDLSCWDYVATRIARCEGQAIGRSLTPQLHGCRKGRWLTAGDAIVSDTEADEHRSRAWRFFRELLFTAQKTLSERRLLWQAIHEANPDDKEQKQKLQAQIDTLSRIVDGIAAQLFFGSGAFATKQNQDEDALTQPQARRFWNEAADLFEALANEYHPHTAHHVLEAMIHLQPADPARTFLCAAKAIETSNAWGFLQESLVVDDVEKLIHRLLSDHRHVLRVSTDGNSDCLQALLRLLDMLVDAGWSKARALTHRLEDIYR